MESASTSNESIMGFFGELGIDPSFTSDGLNSLASVNSKYLRDLKLNVSTMLAAKNKRVNVTDQDQKALATLAMTPIAPLLNTAGGLSAQRPSSLVATRAKEESIHDHDAGRLAKICK